jgi:hypothetical protein
VDDLDIRVRFLAAARDFFFPFLEPASLQALSLGAKRPGVKPTIDLYLVPRLRVVVLYLHFPIRFHGVMIN